MVNLHKMDLVGCGFFIACVFFIVLYPTTLFLSVVSLFVSCGLSSRFLFVFLRFFFNEDYDHGIEREEDSFKKYVVLRIVGTFLSLIIVLTCLYFLFRIPAYITGKTPEDLYRFYRIRDSLQMSHKEKMNTLKVIQKTMGVPPSGATFKTHVQYFFLSLFNLLMFQFGYRSTVPPFRIISLVLPSLPYTLSLLGIYAFLSMIVRLMLHKKREKWLQAKGTRTTNLPGLSLPSSIYWVVPTFLWLAVIMVEWLFNLPGIGRMFLQAATFPKIDYITAHVLTYFMVFTSLFINLIADLVFVFFYSLEEKKETYDII